MSRIIFTICLLFVPSTLQAAMLAQFTWNTPQVIQAPATFRVFRFSAGVPGPSVNWTTTTSNLNSTIVAEPATVEAFQSIWSSGHGPWSLISLDIFDSVNGFQTPPEVRFGASMDWILETPGGRWQSQMFVPKKGIAFEGYDLTGMERIVTPTSQTIKVYGESIPEPSTFLMAIILCGLAAAMLAHNHIALRR